jgi:hypothetical protein
MLLPQKHLRLSDSIIGLASYLLETLDSPTSIDNIWLKFQKVSGTSKFPAYHPFENFILALDFLFLISVIREDHGIIIRCA